ncbi:hypothetical protein EGW08_020399 [Elysia chlorotica]|uniref:Uncharacterized protein n=1 Tax=Elysia chlorotica TaxID=188477 RepID=A0A3S1B4L6_ELYCH|nr:hypothetical protein EGW08_020399 [Elysia chlorotica]
MLLHEHVGLLAFSVAQLFIVPVLADINSGCPSWGCLPQGTFSFSAGIPTATNKLTWSTEIDQISGSVDDLSFQGCVSDQQTVVCPTSRGYVSLDPENGNVLWNYTTKTAPYLPVMDIYGDVIGMDTESLYYVASDGKPKQPINIKILQPAFSIMVANDSILFLTSTSTETGQVVTYGTDGVVDASITLTGVVERVNGTFVPSSQPIISGFRVYLLTEFVPTDMTSKAAQESLGMQRLYAFDLRARMADRIHTVWFYNLEMEGNHKHPTKNGGPYRTRGSDPGIIPPIVMYYKGVVYINNVGPQAGRTPNAKDNQPYSSMLWAFRDNGNDATLLYKKTCWYGPMAVYDTYNDLDSRGNHGTSTSSSWTRTSEEDNPIIWILNRSPAMIAGHNAKDGSVIGRIDLAGVSKVEGWATSKMGVTRLSVNSTKDVIVVGMQDSSGEAFLVAVEVDRKMPNNASLMFSTKIGGVSLHQSLKSKTQENPAHDDQERVPVWDSRWNDKLYLQAGSYKTDRMASDSTSFRVAGQIVNVAFQKFQAPKTKAGGYWARDRQGQAQGMTDWKLGVVALVEEIGAGYSKLHVAAVF